MEMEPFPNLERRWDSENVGVIREARWAGKTDGCWEALGRLAAAIERARCPPEPLLFGM